MDIGTIICTPFSYIISAVNSWTGNYILALLAFTLVMKIVLFPLAIKQQKNSVRQARLRPKEEAIRAKYAGRTDKPTQQKMQQEIMEMYQKEKFSPFSGCMPLLLQLPLLLILYSIVRLPLQYTARYEPSEIENLEKAYVLHEYYEKQNGGSDEGYTLAAGENGAFVLTGFADGSTHTVTVTAANSVYTITDNAVEENEGKSQARLEQSKLVTPLRERAEEYAAWYDIVSGTAGSGEALSLATRPPQFSLFGGAIDLGDQPSFSPITWLISIPVLVFVTSLGGQFITKKFTYQPGAQENQSSMRLMTFIMPLFSVYISFLVPAALAVYWILQNLVSPLQQILVAKLYPVPKLTPEELKKAKDEYLAKQKGKREKSALSAPKRRSLVYDDDEDDGAAAEESDEAEETEPERRPASAGQADTPIAKAPLQDQPSKTSSKKK